MTAPQYDVIVVGAGPVGDTMALLLAEQGLRVLTAEKAAEIYPLPRAAHIDYEVMRVFQRLGAAEEVLATSLPAGRYDFVTAGGEILMQFKPGESPNGWPVSNMIHQPAIEAILRRRMAASPEIVLRTQWELTALSQSDDGVTARFATPDGTAEATARYLIGCDGASSRVRGLLGTPIEDLQFDEPWLVIDTIVRDPSRLPAVNLQVCDPLRPTTCVQMGSGRHRWEFMLHPGETADMALDDGFIARLLAPWNVDGAVSLERKAVYRFHALIAETWRTGNVFLAGDAAHQTPPFAGQGLCAGIRDAANLAWKLGAITRDEASKRLLDTYEQERRPNVRYYIDLALMMGRTVCVLDPAAAAARDAAMLAQREATGGAPLPAGAPDPLRAGCLVPATRGAGTQLPQPCAGQARLDDVLGPGACLLSRAEASVPPVQGLRCLDLTSAALAPFRGALSACLDDWRAEAVLVRPDRYVFGTGQPAELAELWRAALH